MPAPSDLVHETSTTTGTGNLTLSNANGKRSFNTAFGTGGSNVFDYYISNRDAAEWERGTGSLSAASTLVRDTVIASSNANAAVNFSAGTKDVTNDVPAGNQPRLDAANNFTAANQFASIELGHASDTTLSRASAGILAVEGVNQVNVSATQTLTNKDISGATNTYRAASDTATGAIEIAVQSEMETGTDTTRAVVPGRQHFHQSAAKAHAAFNGTGTPAFLTGNAQYNAATITDIATGSWRVNFTTSLSSANFTSITKGDGSDAFLATSTKSSDLTSGVHVQTLNSLFASTDTVGAHAAVFGDI